MINCNRIQEPGISHDKTALCGDCDLFGCKVRNISCSSEIEATWGHGTETRSEGTASQCFLISLSSL